MGPDGAGRGRPATGVCKRLIEYLETINHRGRVGNSVTLLYLEKPTSLVVYHFTLYVLMMPFIEVMVKQKCIPPIPS
jgi:hypothetical protein